MGVDKATLCFRGRPMVEIAVEKLRGFCADVSICGNRDELSEYAPVMREARVDAGPAAGIEAGLLAAGQEWCLFVPVDVPLVPGELLRRWAEWVIAEPPREGRYRAFYASFLYTRFGRQPSFALLRRESFSSVKAALDRGVRKLEEVVAWVDEDFGVGALQVVDAEQFTSSMPNNQQVEFWFLNLNTPQEFDHAQQWAESLLD